MDVVKGHEATWNYLEFFLQKFSSVSFMTKIDNNALFEEFMDYQFLTDDEIGAAAFKDAQVTMTDSFNQKYVHYRIDVLWHCISPIKLVETSLNKFKCLPLIASVVLVIPQGNADQERLFSIMIIKKTPDSRSPLNFDGTLSSILSMKTHYPEAIMPCYKLKPDDNLLKKSKGAAMTYNEEHS